MVKYIVSQEQEEVKTSPVSAFTDDWVETGDYDLPPNTKVLIMDQDEDSLYCKILNVESEALEDDIWDSEDYYDDDYEYVQDLAIERARDMEGSHHWIDKSDVVHDLNTTFLTFTPKKKYRYNPMFMNGHSKGLICKNKPHIKKLSKFHKLSKLLNKKKGELMAKLALLSKPKKKTSTRRRRGGTKVKSGKDLLEQIKAINEWKYTVSVSLPF